MQATWSGGGRGLPTTPSRTSSHYGDYVVRILGVGTRSRLLELPARPKLLRGAEAAVASRELVRGIPPAPPDRPALSYVIYVTLHRNLLMECSCI